MYVFTYSLLQWIYTFLFFNLKFYFFNTVLKLYQVLPEGVPVHQFLFPFNMTQSFVFNTFLLHDIIFQDRFRFPVQAIELFFFSEEIYSFSEKCNQKTIPRHSMCSLLLEYHCFQGLYQTNKWVLHVCEHTYTYVFLCRYNLLYPCDLYNLSMEKLDIISSY